MRLEHGLGMAIAGHCMLPGGSLCPEELCGVGTKAQNLFLQRVAQDTH